MKIQVETNQMVVFESALYRTTTTLILGDDYLLLVDPNWLPAEIDFIAQYIEKQQHLPQHKKFMLFTHSDYDHIIAYGRFPGFRTIASSNFVNHDGKQRIIDQIKAFDYKYYIKRNYPVVYPEIDIVINVDQTMEIGGELFQFYQATGHNIDGLITYLPKKHILITGDYLSNIEFPFIDYDYRCYLQTLNKLEAIFNSEDIMILITGHGDATQSVKEMKKRLTDARHYLDTIERHVLSGKPFDMKSLVDQYEFYPGMIEIHQDNIQKVRLALASS